MNCEEWNDVFSMKFAKCVLCQPIRQRMREHSPPFASLLDEAAALQFCDLPVQFVGIRTRNVRKNHQLITFFIEIIAIE